MRFLFPVILAMSILPLRAEQTIEKGAVVVLPVEGAISEAQFFFMRRVLKNAESAGASALILDMDTPGGALKSTERIVQMLMKSSVPVYTYVNTNAGSAGALIALGTKKVFMAPISAIGAAAPVVSSGEEIPATMNAKVVSYYSGYFRSVAERNCYHPELVDGFMNLDKEVKVGEEVINPKGALLTLSAQEAVRVVGDRPLLASGIAKDISEVCKDAGLESKAVVRIQPSGFEILAQWITILAPVLLLGGIIGAYIEFKTPGTIVPGVLSAFCFLLFFAGHYIAGLTGLEVAAVFALGVLLVLTELLFFPGVALVAALGVALMIGALFLPWWISTPPSRWIFLSNCWRGRCSTCHSRLLPPYFRSRSSRATSLTSRFSAACSYPPNRSPAHRSPRSRPPKKLRRCPSEIGEPPAPSSVHPAKPFLEIFWSMS